MKTPNDISNSEAVSGRALRLLIRLSGLKQVYIAERFDITDVYLNYILADARKAVKIRAKIYNYLLSINSFNEKLAA